MLHDRVFHGGPFLLWREVLHASGYAKPEDLGSVLWARARWAAEHIFAPLRVAFAWPLVVRSGIRDPAANSRCGGAPKSRHLFGDAYDLRPEGELSVKELLRLYNLIDQLQLNELLPAGGLALYLADDGRPRFVHVDGRGHRARWNLDHLERAVRSLRLVVE